MSGTKDDTQEQVDGQEDTSGKDADTGSGPDVQVNVDNSGNGSEK